MKWLLKVIHLFMRHQWEYISWDHRECLFCDRQEEYCAINDSWRQIVDGAVDNSDSTVR